MITSLLLMTALCGAKPPPLIPTNPMRLRQIYEQTERNRAQWIPPGALPYPYPQLPSYPRAFDNYYPYYYPYYWR